jgi:hypothetical protein
MWYIKQDVARYSSVHTPVVVRLPPAATLVATLPGIERLQLMDTDFVSIYNPNDKLYLNVMDNCANVSFGASKMCLQWGSVKRPYQYSSFRIYSPHTQSASVTVENPMVLYLPYFAMWFSDNSADGNLSSVSTNSEVKILNTDATNHTVCENVRYKIKTHSGFFDAVELIFNKITFI